MPDRSGPVPTPVAVRPHYPFVTRIAAELFNHGALANVTALQIEPEYGYVTRLTYADGSCRLTRGNDVGLNAAAAVAAVRDKAYAKHFLGEAGVATAAGASFLMRWWAKRLQATLGDRGLPAMRTADDAVAYRRAHLDLPVYVKPVDGSLGLDVWRCPDDQHLRRVLDSYERERIRVALVEQALTMPDYRLVVLDGTVISAYRRVPFTVTGDGRTPVAELVLARRDELTGAGRGVQPDLADERLLARLRQLALDWDTVLPTDAVLRLRDISNLSAGGTAVDLTDRAAPRWRRLAVDVARLFGLRFAGVDLACADLTSSDGGYAVIEVNGAPGLDHFGATGPAQDDLVRRLYAQILNTPGGGRPGSAGLPGPDASFGPGGPAGGSGGPAGPP